MNRMPPKGRDSTADAPQNGYRQIAHSVGDWLRMGRFRAGQRIPTEIELAEHFGVARLTVRRALRVLVDGGMLERRGPRGTFVADGQQRQPVVAPLEQWNRQIADTTAGTSWRLIDSREAPPPAAVAEALRIADGTPVLELTILRLQDALPIALMAVHLAPWARALIGPIDFGAGRMLRGVLAEAGIEPARVRQSLGAQIADPELAARLGIDTNLPVLTVLRTTTDFADRPITCDQIYIRADKHRYDIEFVRHVD